ncbi:RasGEF domain containing protein [Tritrichomonas foetus]|uniref:RasGEF domain containing protein n=1 Tax=Tritrichomonas foetus TaxID=1144522 RepID=A0A1J4KYH4_9EUKA|nr:RasGEF domain containing protein [Tritrichomonas foetus]|eukprot:OHT16307.1 RasGEF domain containing protein [Tritrichomonas foetus]
MSESKSESTNPKDGEIQNEDKCLWMCRAMEEDSEALELRERTYPWTKTHSFGVLKRANFTSCRAHLDRHRVLELVYQHLHSIGMHHVAFTLADETKLEFQRKDQKMDRTDLRLLISMSLGPRDNLWDDSGIDCTVLAEEPFDDDNASVRYVEPVEKIVNALNGKYDKKVQFIDGIKNGSNFSEISFAPLIFLIANIVSNNPKVIVTKDDRFKFYLLLNSICHSSHFFEHIMYLYHHKETAVTVKSNILKIVIEWVTFSGLFIGKNTLREISRFLQTIENEEAKDLFSVIPNLPYGNPIIDDLPPAPVLGDNPVKLLHPNLTLADPEAEEVARQISLVVHGLYSAVHPREFYIAISQRSLSLETKGLYELFEFGKKLKNLIAATILSEKNVNQTKNKFTMMINIASKLLDINNFEALSWFVSAFDMKCIKNLSRLVSSLSDESKNKLNELRENYDWKKSQSPTYELKLKQCYQNKMPSIPNMRYELSVVAVNGYGGDEFRGNLVNWGKRNIAAEFIQKYNQFQNTKYNYHRISQIQKVLSQGTRFTKEDLNAFSLDIESPIKDDVI